MLFLADATVVLHLVYLGLVIGGALFTRGRPGWTALHIAALCWGIAVEAGPWSCPLTLAEQYCVVRAGGGAYQGSFLLHLLDALLYPNLPYTLVTALGVGVCALNLGIYARRGFQYLRRPRVC